MATKRHEKKSPYNPEEFSSPLGSESHALGATRRCAHFEERQEEVDGWAQRDGIGRS